MIDFLFQVTEAQPKGGRREKAATTSRRKKEGEKTAMH